MHIQTTNIAGFFKSYEVLPDGRILIHTHYANGQINSQFVKGTKVGNKRRVSFAKADGSRISRNIHELVAEAFLSWDKFGDKEIIFKNDNPEDCRVENLELRVKQPTYAYQRKPSVDLTGITRGVQIKVTDKHAYPDCPSATRTYTLLDNRTANLFEPNTPTYQQPTNPTYNQYTTPN